jgi:hypothetical protein
MSAAQAEINNSIIQSTHIQFVSVATISNATVSNATASVATVSVATASNATVSNATASNATASVATVSNATASVATVSVALEALEEEVVSPSIKKELSLEHPADIEGSNTFEEALEPTLDGILTDIQDFGIFRFKVAEVPKTSKKQFLYLKNDISGSMEQKCSDGLSKYEHANHTICNILRLASNLEDLEIWVQVDAFDDRIDRIIPAQRVTKNNLLQLQSLVKFMTPRNGTNLEMALTDSCEQIAHFLASNPDFDATHIFTTDGEATVGSKDNNVLKKNVNPDYYNFFVGYGLSHSEPTMTALASNRYAEYHFIDKIESGGIIFGGIMHKILYSALKNITLTATEAEFYNHETNTWSSTYKIDSLPGEAVRTLHMRSSNRLDVEVTIEADHLDQNQNQKVLHTIFNLPALILQDGTYEPPQENLAQYIFRQRTLELLFKAKNDHPSNELLTELLGFKNRLNNYMEYHNLNNDPAFQSLNDDLVVVIKTHNTPYQRMYAKARGDSNGNERQYSVSTLPPQRQNAISGFGRSHAIWNSLEETDNDDNSNMRMLSQAPISRHLSSKTAVELMRSVSAGTRAATDLDTFLEEEEQEQEQEV